jgi:fructose-specific phosphotransferase system IIC component
LGLHRFYLYGLTDLLAWLLPIPTALGFYGLERVQKFGQDDTLSWMLIPLLGFTIAGCAMNAIVYGLTPIEKWNAKFNPQADALTPAGRTQWGTIIGIVVALLLGTTVLMSSLVFSLQRYFEYQIEAARLISQ